MASIAGLEVLDEDFNRDRIKIKSHLILLSADGQQALMAEEILKCTRCGIG